MNIIKHISFAELSTITQDDLKKSLYNEILYENSDELNIYFQKRIDRYGVYGVIPYYLNPLHRKYYKDNKYRYLIVDFPNDKVVFFFKFILMFKNVFIRLVGLPISKNDIHENEEEVLKTLFENKIISQIYVIEEEKDIAEKIGFQMDGIGNIDLFSLVEERLEHMSTNKWIRKSRIRKFTDDINLTFKAGVDFNDVLKIKKLYNDWVRYKEGNGVQVTDKRLYENLITDLINPNGDILVYSVYYRGLLLVSGVFLLVLNKYARCDMELNIAMTDFRGNWGDKIEEEDLCKIEELLPYVSKYYMYMFVQDMQKRGIVSYYNAGMSYGPDVTNDDKVCEHKKNNDDRVVNYYKSSVIK